MTLVVGACVVGTGGLRCSCETSPLIGRWYGRLSELEKLGFPLLSRSARELLFGSLLAYAESAFESRLSFLSLSFEWNGLERRHFDRFSLSGDELVLEGIVEYDSCVFNVGTAGVSLERRFAD